jgi:hypothetical protein
MRRSAASRIFSRVPGLRHSGSFDFKGTPTGDRDHTPTGPLCPTPAPDASEGGLTSEKRARHVRDRVVDQIAKSD